MNRERAKELLPIITAFAEGKTIQHNLAAGGWDDTDKLSADTMCLTYRIKPEPFECWVNIYGGDLNLYSYHTEKLALADSRDGREPIKSAIHMREVDES